MSHEVDGIQAGFDAQPREAKRPRDEVRLALMEALARRAAAQPDSVRALLEARLLQLSQFDEKARHANCADDANAPQAGAAAPTPTTQSDATRVLADLLAHLEREARARPATSHDIGPVPAAHPRALDEVRRISLHARTESQLRQALEPAPENSGPLNSARLVHRALSLMQDASPGYLSTFLSYVDMLARLEALHVASPGAPEPARPAARPARKRTRKSPPA